MRRSHLVYLALLFCLVAVELIRCAGLPPNLMDPFLEDPDHWEKALSSLRRVVGFNAPAESLITSNKGASSSVAVVSAGSEEPRVAPAAPYVTPSALLHTPYMIKPLTSHQRQDILSHYWQVRKTNRQMRVRPVLPLIKENIGPDEYRLLFSGLISPGNSRRVPPRSYWVVDGVTYLVGRPDKPSMEFLNLHGAMGSRSQNMYAIWRLEIYGEARVWRYLGVLDMPGYRLMNTFIGQHWTRLGTTFTWPTRFLNDATHFDPDHEAATMATSNANAASHTRSFSDGQT
ncbi:conserved hypothetical Ustilaginaceae-specific protein [Sporisorium reilianum SRZ2]|uniref:Conserved hypothetical Ustilaginaceae-specific protein n=1 Tax=Sporisorium reilianum (strain SRZ2) TaxID=999809 RepID=E6ZUW9_SPORE|nr:conserved hypothetical Ustilaginaceae-specific protein [Sporisorium reilianum SRZ2]